jgi:hypothetical protein
MSHQKRLMIAVGVTVLVSFVAAAAYFVHRLNEGVKALKTMSNVAQLQHAMARYFTDHPAWVEEHVPMRDGETVTLDRGRVAALLRDASDAYGADPAVPEDVTLDAWRRPVRVTLRKVESGTVAFEIASFGPDGVEGTADDILFSDKVLAPSTQPAVGGHDADGERQPTSERESG